ncbi:MAG TPA: hypothetical protein VK027_08805 [Chitinophagaceae bacterium]|nr:hypothetical protein [Chitinophagaceae bacterium]
MRNLIVKTIVLSALIPSIYLMGISLFLLIPALFENIKYNSFLDTTILFFSIIFGILGFVAFIFQLFYKSKSKVKIKILFLLLSIIGYFTFISFERGIQGWKNMFDSLINIKDNLIDFYMVLWPVLVSLFLLIYNLVFLNRINKNTSRNHFIGNNE